MATSFPVDSSNRDDDAWAWLEPQIHQHGRQLYRFALGVLGNREDAEDATQIVVLNAYRGLVRGELPTWPRAWLFAIALNVCRRLRRQAGARHALVASTRELLSLGPGSDAPTGTEILHALSSLPSAQRRIFLLRELRGLSYAELSERLDLSPAAAESLLARARRRLREELAPSDESDLRSPRRLPLISIPGAGAVLRLVRAPPTFKLAGFAGTVAIAPALVVGLHAVPGRSQPPGLQAAAPPIVQPVQRTFARPAVRLSPPLAPPARPTRSSPPRALPAGARSLGPASAGPATVPTATAAVASPETEAGTAGFASRQSSPASDSSPGVRGRPPAKPSGTTLPGPIVDATAGHEAVDHALATTLGATVDELAAVVPAVVPAPVPPDVIPDAVPEGVVPDPPPVVQGVLGVASSAVSASADAASSAVPTLPDVLP
jgi:RNA polymerase sigma-70 factor (ECF subfamily)